MPTHVFPKRSFIVVIAVVCAALGVSAFYGYRRLVQLHDVFLQNRAGAIAESLMEQMRGPQRWQVSEWESAMREAVESNMDPALRLLVLLDGKGQALASVGETGQAGLFTLDSEVHTPRRAGRQTGQRGWGGGGPGSAGGGPYPGGLILRVGIDRSEADFIVNQAYLQLAISGLAIATLIVVAFFLLRTLERFLELQSRQESQRHLAALGQMSATLAHEIRNPLGAIKGLTQVVQERIALDDQTQALMTTVVSEAERLEKLVTDLLAFSRPRQVEVVEFDFNRLIDEVVTSLRDQAQQKGLTLTLPDPHSPLFAKTDPDGLKQILLNVIMNAMDASPQGGAIDIKAESEAGQLVIRVSDQGAGLEEQDPDHLFEPFVTTKTKGTGLGLSISRQIAERLGGGVSLSNRPGGGAVCVVRIGAGRS